MSCLRNSTARREIGQLILLCKLSSHQNISSCFREHKIQLENFRTGTNKQPNSVQCLSYLADVHNLSGIIHSVLMMDCTFSMARILHIQS